MNQLHAPGVTGSNDALILGLYREYLSACFAADACVESAYAGKKGGIAIRVDRLATDNYTRDWALKRAMLCVQADTVAGAACQISALLAVHDKDPFIDEHAEQERQDLIRIGLWSVKNAMGRIAGAQAGNEYDLTVLHCDPFRSDLPALIVEWREFLGVLA